MRRAFNFYHSYYEVYCGLDDKQKNQFIEALIEVQFLSKHIDKIEFEDKMLNIVWKAIKHSVKKQIEGYCNSIQTNYEALFYDNPSASEAVLSSASTQVQGEGEGEGQVQGEVQEGINASLRSASVKKGDMFDVEFEQFYATYGICIEQALKLTGLSMAPSKKQNQKLKHNSSSYIKMLIGIAWKTYSIGFWIMLTTSLQHQKGLLKTWSGGTMKQ